MASDCHLIVIGLPLMASDCLWLPSDCPLIVLGLSSDYILHLTLQAGRVLQSGATTALLAAPGPFAELLAEAGLMDAPPTWPYAEASALYAALGHLLLPQLLPQL